MKKFLACHEFLPSSLIKMSLMKVMGLVLFLISLLVINTESLLGQPPNQPPQGGNRPSRRGWANPQDAKPEVQKKTFEEQYPNAGPLDVLQIDHPNYISSDRKFLVADFRKGKADENTIPVIILHSYGASKEQVTPLAITLAAAGMAVLTPDLRGHGKSISQRVVDFSTGNRPTLRTDDTYTVSSFNQVDFTSMANIDGEFWYSFLIAEHNKKHLNIRKLIIVGVDFGAAIACSWAKNDWSVTNAKRGRFTKGLVLLSPKEELCQAAIDSLRQKRTGDQLGYLFVVGNLNTELSKGVAQLQKKILGNNTEDTPIEDRQAVTASFKTEQQGATLLTMASFKVPDIIKTFIEKRMEKQKPRDLEWQEIKMEEE